MFINKKITILFLSFCILGLSNKVSASNVVNDENKFELNINKLKVTQENIKKLPVWDVVDNIKSDLYKKIEQGDSIDLYNEITGFLENSVEIEQFLKLFIPRLTKELQSDKFNNNTLGIIDEALNWKLELNDILLLEKLSKNKMLFQKLLYVSLNIILSWSHDFAEGILNNRAASNPFLIKRVNKYIEILDLITEKTDEKIQLLKQTNSIKKDANPNTVAKLLAKINFEKMAITPISNKIIELLPNTQNFVKKIAFKNDLFNSKTNTELELKLSMKNTAITAFQNTFTEKEIAELIEYFDTDLFLKLTTMKHKQSGKIALLHIINVLADQAQVFYKQKVQ